MKIGILTFHWATNYGAILQCYALQTFLHNQGHDVKIINYKPRIYDNSFYNFLRYRRFMNLKQYFISVKKERSLESFRKNKLYLTDRISTYEEVKYIALDYEVIISGSDQVLNPFFLRNGENKGLMTPTYFLGFPFNGKKIGYALSFGCNEYPEELSSFASQCLLEFSKISVRESTGLEILKRMKIQNSTIVPDPTLLLESDFYHSLANECHVYLTTNYIYAFFIRNIDEYKSIIKPLLSDKFVLYNNEDGNYSLSSWLNKIKSADSVITDSFHCMVMCLKFHIPFKVITPIAGNIGMNDRFYTLLSKLNLLDAILIKDSINEINFSLIEWEKVDTILEEYKSVGDLFLNI